MAKGDTRDCDQLVQEPYFTMRHIELALASAARSGVVAKDVRFTFGQRLDLSGNPFNLSSTGLVTVEVKDDHVPTGRFAPK